MRLITCLALASSFLALSAAQATPIAPSNGVGTTNSAIIYTDPTDPFAFDIFPFSARNGVINTLQTQGVVRPTEPANSATGSGVFSGGFNDGSGFLQTGSSRGGDAEGSATPFEPSAQTNTSVSFTGTYTNSLSSAQNFTLDLNLPSFFASLSAGQTSEAAAGSANFRFEVLANGTSLFDLMFAAEVDATNTLTNLIFTRNGTSLLSTDGSSDACNRNEVLECALSALSTSFNLGTFNPGEFVSLAVNVSGITAIGADANGLAFGSARGPNASVSLGGFNERFSLNVNAAPANAQPVSEPASLALLGAGLLGLGLAARRRRAAA